MRDYRTQRQQAVHNYFRWTPYRGTSYNARALRGARASVIAEASRLIGAHGLFDLSPAALSHDGGRLVQEAGQEAPHLNRDGVAPLLRGELGPRADHLRFDCVHPSGGYSQGIRWMYTVLVPEWQVRWYFEALTHRARGHWATRAGGLHDFLHYRYQELS